MYPYILSIYPYVHMSIYHRSIYPYIHISIYPYIHIFIPRSTQEHPGGTQEHQGDTQGTPRGHPEAPRAPEVILSENLPKPLSFTVKMAANTYFVREWRRRHAPFPQPAHKNESTQPRTERNPRQGPFTNTVRTPTDKSVWGMTSKIPDAPLGAPFL